MIGWMQDIQNDSFVFFFFFVRRALVVPSFLSAICPSGIIISIRWRDSLLCLLDGRTIGRQHWILLCCIVPADVDVGVVV